MEKSLLSPVGRIGFRTFWRRWLICALINFLGMAILGRMMDGSALGLAYGINLILLVFIYIQGTKRLHDINKNGWFMLIPIYNIILLLGTGDPEANRFGEAPSPKS